MNARLRLLILILAAGHLLSPVVILSRQQSGAAAVAKDL